MFLSLSQTLNRSVGFPVVQRPQDQHGRRAPKVSWEVRDEDHGVGVLPRRRGREVLPEETLRDGVYEVYGGKDRTARQELSSRTEY